MMNSSLFAVIVIALFAVLSGCDSEPQQPADFPQDVGPGQDDGESFRRDGSLSFLRDGEELIEIAIEIAETDLARQRGLMERQSLPDRSGMLFIFDEEEPRSFWMANTPLALDIMFADADSQLVTIRKYTRPMSSQSVTSGGAPAQYVVEVPAGFSDSHGIIEGDRITWTRIEDELP